MPNKNSYIIIVLKITLIVIGLSYSLSAQISPGKLSRPHSQLEGVNNCTQCHTLGKAVTNDKCLLCHSLLNERINSKKGFHSSQEIKGKDCFTCHSEHHGLNFEMIRFDKNNFDHNKTGYELKGAHKRQDCNACHKDERINNSEIVKLNRTYLGLSTQCNSCHEDIHQNSLGTNCSSCHDSEHFKPASLFNHSKSKFPLLGAHLSVECKECHLQEIKNGKAFQKFANLKFNSCVSCHNDTHQGKYGTQCNACHQESSFSKIKTKPSFNHSVTSFKLEGKHKHLDCKSCHDNRNNPSKQFKEFVAIDNIKCINCHKDPHEGKFGEQCKDCHNQESFNIDRDLNNFNHTLTEFPLSGKHTTVSCKKCHVTNMTNPLKHYQCIDCHNDFHQGQFKNNSETKDCSSCHNTDGFSNTSFSISDHQNTSFPLTGAHIAIACNDCHLKNNQWTFKPIPTHCTQCHQNFHEGKMDPKFYSNNACVSCHNTEAWNSIRFDHSNTNFPLTGKHTDLFCSQCHIKISDKGEKIQSFKNLISTCAVCHENIHGTQFEKNGVTKCDDCHNSDSWFPQLFDHDKTRFKLEGAHIKISCNSCHFSEIQGGKAVTLYRIGKLECRDCHL
ncbi:MAG: cytochrome c family protein [Saprospiraceae bacterium]|nr:cytochrome c family protein [Saprospiraceae bacterium]